MPFYERLAQLCQEKGFDVTKIGQFVQVNGTPISTSAVSTWKSGVVPRNVTIKALADYFKVPVGYLTGQNEKNAAAHGDCDNCSARDGCPCVLSAQEKELLRKFRGSSEDGKMQMIYEIMRIWNQEPGRARE